MFAGHECASVGLVSPIASWSTLEPGVPGVPYGPCGDEDDFAAACVRAHRAVDDGRPGEGDMGVTEVGDTGGAMLGDRGRCGERLPDVTDWLEAVLDLRGQLRRSLSWSSARCASSSGAQCCLDRCSWRVAGAHQLWSLVLVSVG